MYTFDILTGLPQIFSKKKKVTFHRSIIRLLVYIPQLKLGNTNQTTISVTQRY